MLSNFWIVTISIFLVLVIAVVLFREARQKPRYTWKAQGEANNYRIMDEGHWFAIVQLNGEIHHAAQEEYMDVIVESLNNP